jgi:hypothetical protein
MWWQRMIARWFPGPSDDELKAAARRETERLQAELERMDVRIELATHRSIQELERELREMRTMQ